LDDAALVALLTEMLSENDHESLSWVTGQTRALNPFAALDRGHPRLICLQTRLLGGICPHGWSAALRRHPPSLTIFFSFIFQLSAPIGNVRS